MLRQLLDSYIPDNEEEQAVKRQTLQFLATNPDAFSRDNLIGHIVADAWIVNRARDKVLLVEHLLNKEWCAPGGHCDGDSDVINVARREALEETGTADMTLLNNGQIFDITSHGVPLRPKNGVLEPSHIHICICFAFEADETKPLQISDESTGLKWVRLDEIDQLNYKKSHYRRLGKTARI